MQHDADSQFIKDYMNSHYHPSAMRSTVLFGFVFTDFFLFFAILGDLFPTQLTALLVTGLIPVHVLGLLLLIRPYGYQVLGRLFVGLFAIMSSLVFLCFGVELMVMMLGKWTVPYRATLYTAYAVWIALLIRWHLENFRNRHYTQSRKENPRIAEQQKRAGKAASVFFIGHILFGLLTGTFVPATEMGIIIIIAAALPFFAQHLHRYLLIRRHPEMLILHEPVLRLSKREQRLARKRKQSVGTKKDKPHHP